MPVHLKPNPYKPGKANYRLVESGTPIWVFIGRVEAASGDLSGVADEHEISPAQIDAALACYERYKEIVDDKRLSNSESRLPQ